MHFACSHGTVRPYLTWDIWCITLWMINTHNHKTSFLEVCVHADVGNRAAQCLMKVHFYSFQWLPNYFFCLSDPGVGHQAQKICSPNWITLLLLMSSDQEMPHLQLRSKWERLFSFASVLWALLFNTKAALCKVAHKWLIKSVFTACKVHQDFTLPCLGRFIFVFAIWG